MEIKTNFAKFKGILSKIILMIFVAVLFLFQIISFSTTSTNAELREQIRQVQLLANLNLNQDSSNRYKVSTLSDLQSLSTYVKDGGTTSGKVFIQTNAIDMCDTEFTPIGSPNSPFKGTYDGGNFSLSNLKVTTYTGNAGLFGICNGGFIKNLTIASGTVNLKSSGGSAGAFVGYASNKTSIENCININCTVTCDSTIKNSSTLGGIVGRILGTAWNSFANIKNSYNSAEINNTSVNAQVSGGIAGEATFTKISLCTNNGKVISESTNTSFTKEDPEIADFSFAGGIVGNNVSCSLESCLNGGSVYAQGQADGVAQSSGTRTTIIDTTLKRLNSVQVKANIWSQTIKCLSIAGGICGLIQKNENVDDLPLLKTCVNTGNVSAPQSISYLDATIMVVCGSSTIDRFDFSSYIIASSKTIRIENSGGSYGMKLTGHQAYGIGCNLAEADLNSCYSIKTDENQDFCRITRGTSSVYRCMAVGANLTSVDPTLEVSDYSKYADPKKTLDYTQQNSVKYYSLPLCLKLLSSGENKLIAAYVSFTTRSQAGITAASVSVNFFGTYEDGMLWWYEVKDFSESFDVFAIAISNFNQIVNCNGAEPELDDDQTMNEYMKTSDFVDALGSNWAISESINSGYPHLKHFYWQDNTATPS